MFHLNSSEWVGIIYLRVRMKYVDIFSKFILHYNVLFIGYLWLHYWKNIEIASASETGKALQMDKHCPGMLQLKQGNLVDVFA